MSNFLLYHNNIPFEQEDNDIHRVCWPEVLLLFLEYFLINKLQKLISDETTVNGVSLWLENFILGYRKEGPEETGQNGHRSWNHYMEGKIEWIWMVCLWKKRLREDKVVFKYIKGRK